MPHLQVRRVLTVWLALTMAALTVSSAHAQDPTTFVQLPDGAARFEVTLPSGQAYVELFVRQNGVQNTAQAIQASGVSLKDKPGYSRYSYQRGAFKAGDKIEYRFYSYRPSSPGVFSPGPAEMVWNTQVYGAACASSFDTLAGSFCLDATPAKQISVYGATGSEFIRQQSVGWELHPALLPSLATPALRSKAELLGVFVKVCATGKWQPIEETPYAPISDSEKVDAGVYSYTPQNLNTTFPGTAVRSTYACGGRFVTIPTLVGPQTLLTDATVEFAYLVEHYN
jgi:hypothetical protein